jgi:creatinine amidohydrolase
VQEYHGEHLPLGVDLLAVTRCLDRLEAEAPHSLILLPAFAYGAASHASPILKSCANRSASCA